MKRWNDTYRLRAVRDEQRRKKLEQRPPTPENVRTAGKTAGIGVIGYDGGATREDAIALCRDRRA